MTDFGDDILEAVDDVIDEVGISGTFTRPAGDYSVGGGNVSGSPVTVTLTCSPPLNYSDRHLAQGLVERGDARLFIRGVDALAASYTPEKNDQVDFGSGTWRVVEVTVHQPDERVAAYDLQLRQ